MSDNKQNNVNSIVNFFGSMQLDATGNYKTTARRYQTRVYVDKNGQQRGGNIAAITKDAPVFRFFNRITKEYNEFAKTTFTAIELAAKIDRFETLAAFFQAYKGDVSAEKVNQLGGNIVTMLKKEFSEHIVDAKGFGHAAILQILKAAAKQYALTPEYVAPVKKAVTVIPAELVELRQQKKEMEAKIQVLNEQVRLNQQIGA